MVSPPARRAGREGPPQRLSGADEIAAEGADHVALAIGSLPDEAGFQRALPHLAALPGIERGRVWSPEDVLAKRARLGDHVLVLDEGGSWRGAGTAWALAEAGHRVTLVTPDPMVGKGAAAQRRRPAAPRRLAALRRATAVESAIVDWLGNGGGAEVVSLLTGAASGSRPTTW